MGIPTVAVYSEADRLALHVRLADEALAIGPAAASESYLDIGRILEAAKRAGADAIHPGYGFLSENAAFAEACQQAGVKFIGPGAPSMRLMGSKTRAREAMIRNGVPVVPGSTTALGSLQEGLQAASQTGFPVMLKATGGGGGKGMRLVQSAEEMPSAFEQARSEALRAFGNDEVYIEKAILAPRHVEVQVLADENGNVIHLGERECSLQRRHQKVIEESPSPLVEQCPEVREKLTAAAVRAARAAGYHNAGTVEFLMDASGAFYFLEMNTRLQVEHAVTELVTGLDLVREQILIAAGEKLRYRQEDIRLQGSAIECRIYAEDPDNDFFPSPGRITVLEQPQGPGLRVDSGAYEGWTVPVEYDPLIAKLAAWGQTRSEAIDRLLGALREYHVGGIKTTIPFFREIMADSGFRRGEIDTGFIPRWFARRQSEKATAVSSAEDEAVAVLAAGLHFLKDGGRANQAVPARNSSAWKTAGKQSMVRSA
jgi:acetyl-CoA carboxylase biotin carboxylase subunit